MVKFTLWGGFGADLNFREKRNVYHYSSIPRSPRFFRINFALLKKIPAVRQAHPLRSASEALLTFSHEPINNAGCALAGNTRLLSRLKAIGMILIIY